MKRYVPVVVHQVRMRSCYIYTLKPRRWLWLAKICLWLQMTFMESECEALICNQVQAQTYVATFRNWLGENRIGR